MVGQKYGRSETFTQEWLFVTASAYEQPHAFCLAQPESERVNPRPPVDHCYLAPVASRCYSHGKQETDEEFDARWVTYFNKPDIDAWELKKGMNTLIGYDLVPEPKILDAALRACRRLNDLASAIRILEAVKDKAGPHKEIYPYVIQELRPTLSELGISTPEELGMDKA
ncbi:Cytochrome c oxidase subunit 5A, mitochondrial [Acipenser ruthenus]|uniref:Cytochrome c oxidase subunit 5A, mitochondrial n=1 Tax=Acipenser ruthenus TaxID=7906 RepID=A0A444UI00_ACIRT|nr:Cytochrome c oxidase subunit 5A, mitochondrial [Acipenser ruthenus]